MPQVLDPGGITAPLPLSVTVILPSPVRDRVGCHTPFDFGATYPFTFVTAYCLPVYASQCLFPPRRDGPPTVQNSVPGCWLNFAGVTISSHQTLCASRRTPRRTGRGALHHPAPSLGPPRRLRIEVMNNLHSGKPACTDCPKRRPRHRTALTASVEPLAQ